MYEIRGLSLSYVNNNAILGILLRNIPAGVYFHFTFNILPSTRISTVFNFLMNELNCGISDILIAPHVNFEKVGIES